MTSPPIPLVLSYLDPDGNIWNLSDYSMQSGVVCSAISGIEGLPVSIQTIPMLDGTAIANSYVPQPGSPIIVLLVGRPAGGGPNDYYNLLDQVVRAFLTRRNEAPAPGYLSVQRPDGTARQIAVYTISGLDSPEVALNDYTIYTLTLQTPDPYWTDGIQNSLIYSLNTASGILPLLPLTFAGSTVLGDTIVTNRGTALAYPVWIITGPGQPTIRNNTTGRAWSLNTSIPAGQIVQVATKPGSQVAVNQTTGANIWDQLVLSSLRDLWPFVGGVNDVNISMVGATAATSVQLSWMNRWSRA